MESKLPREIQIIVCQCIREGLSALDDDMLDNYDFTNAIRYNPFKEKMKNGYDVVIHHGPKPDVPSDIDIIDSAIDRLSFIIYHGFSWY